MNNNPINFNNSVFGFDYDGVLDNKPSYQLLAKYLLNLDKEVYIVTKRLPDEEIEGGSDEVYAISDKLGIDKDNVVFTCNNDKSPFLILYDIQEFWDDTLTNLQEINLNAPQIITHLVK